MSSKYYFEKHFTCNLDRIFWLEYVFSDLIFSVDLKDTILKSGEVDNENTLFKFIVDT